jgi:hypothetical protein
MDATRRAREAVKASAAIAWWVGTVREVQARHNAAKRHLVASRAFSNEGNTAKAQAHLELCNRLIAEIETLQAQHPTEKA